MDNRKPFINIIITTTYACNMNCVYCYNARQSHDGCEKISIETVKKLFEITIPFYKEIHYLWHGGEPLLLGIDFYQQILALQKEMNVHGTKITNAIQTNYSLMDTEFAQFCLDNEIRIGSSFDGTTNDLTRYNTQAILDGYQKYRDLGGKSGFICVVQNKNVNHLIEDYEWFKEHEINYTLNMYIATYPYEEDPLFVEPEIYAQKINELFDVWIKDVDANISINFFEMFFQYFLLNEKRICCYNSCIGKHIGVRYDGSVFGCNRDFPTEYLFGNVNTMNTIDEMYESAGFKRTLQEAIERRNTCKENCEIFDFCAGGCNNVAFKDGRFNKANEQYCTGMTLVYRYIKKQVDIMLEKSLEELKDTINPNAYQYFEKMQKRKEEMKMVEHHMDQHVDET